jgi:hypothetical protein
MSERGASFVDNQVYFKRNTSHSGTFKSGSQQFSSQMGKTIAITSSNVAVAKTQKIPSGAIPTMHSQKLPPASNTVAIEDKQIKQEIKENKWITLLLGIICALIIIIAIASIILFDLSKNEANDSALNNQVYKIETETEWNTEHTEKF